MPLSDSAQALAAELAAGGEGWAVAAARVWGAWEATLKQGQIAGPQWMARRYEDSRAVGFDTATGRIITIRVPGPASDLVATVAVSSSDPLIPELGSEASERAAPDLAMSRS